MLNHSIMHLSSGVIVLPMVLWTFLLERCLIQQEHRHNYTNCLYMPIYLIHLPFDFGQDILLIKTQHIQIDFPT